MADNQSNYEDNQSFSIDIDKIYSDIIQQIDSIRSYINMNNINSIDKLFKSLNADDQYSTPNAISPEKTLQESRCHAFFRIIGFPVVDNKFNIYNPGHDIIKDPNRKIKLKDKIQIGTSPIDGFNKISLKREIYPNNLTKIFISNASSIDAGVMALSCFSSSLKNIKVRKFSSPLDKNPDPFDMDPNNQSYTLELLGLVGSNEVKLQDYKTPDGNIPVQLFDLQNRNHIIKPFIVDSKIDFTVSPSTNKICVPFILNKIYSKIDSVTFADRPLLEQVIRDRFSSINQADSLGESAQSIVNIIKNIPGIQENSLVSKVSSGDYYSLSEKSKFLYFLNVIQEMMTKLVDSLRLVQSAQGKYYWVPLPPSNGPEGGCSVRDVFISNLIDKTLVTSNDFNIWKKVMENSLNINSQTSDTNGTSDLGGFLNNNFFNSFNSTTTEAFGDNVKSSLDRLVLNRKNVLQKANDALRTIEIIMGEISGLGLCDIIAILGALYTMPKEDLIGFLDVDAYNRLISLSEFEYIKDAVPTFDYQSSMKSFSSTLKDFYDLMDKSYHDVAHNAGLSI